MIIKYVIVLVVLLAVAAFVSWAFLPARYLPGNRAGICGSGCICGCTLAEASPRYSACGCTGAAWQRCAAPAALFPSGSASSPRTRIQCSSAGPTTGTGCGSPWKSTCC